MILYSKLKYKYIQNLKKLYKTIVNELYTCDYTCMHTYFVNFVKSNPEQNSLPLNFYILLLMSDEFLRNDLN